MGSESNQPQPKPERIMMAFEATYTMRDGTNRFDLVYSHHTNVRDAEAQIMETVRKAVYNIGIVRWMKDVKAVSLIIA